MLLQVAFILWSSRSNTLAGRYWLPMVVEAMNWVFLNMHERSLSCVWVRPKKKFTKKQLFKISCSESFWMAIILTQTNQRNKDINRRLNNNESHLRFSGKSIPLETKQCVSVSSWCRVEFIFLIFFAFCLPGRLILSIQGSHCRKTLLTHMGITWVSAVLWW